MADEIEISKELMELLPKGVNSLYDSTNNAYSRIVDLMYRSSGSGGYLNSFQTFFVGHDKYQRNILPPNVEHSGLTFITRPKLNLSSSSLRQSSKMLPLDTTNKNDMRFAIRCLLDTKFCRKDEISGASKSPRVNFKNPFNIPLSNALLSISGYPDIILETNTTEGGFHSEDQTFVIGGDDLNKTYDLTLTFKDIQGGPICAMIDFWIEYIRCVTKGIMIAYKEDIDAQRLNYTVSIYRFVVDPKRQVITKYSKATGCYPVSIPLGGMMNMNEGEVTVGTSGKFSVPFKANKIEYNDPEIIADFTALVRRYCGNIDNCLPLPNDAIFNFMGIPWINTDTNGRGMQLEYRIAK